MLDLPSIRPGTESQAALRPCTMAKLRKIKHDFSARTPSCPAGCATPTIGAQGAAHKITECPRRAGILPVPVAYPVRPIGWRFASNVSDRGKQFVDIARQGRGAQQRLQPRLVGDGVDGPL